METGLNQWWQEMPIVTKWLFALSFGLTLGANFGLVNPMYIVLSFPDVFHNFELWRLVTCFFFHGKLGFPFLIHMLFLVRYGQSLEQTTFFGRTADFVFMLLVGSGLLLLIAYFLKLYILGMSLIMMIIYVWSRKNPNVIMSFMFGIRFQSFYFPWVLVGFNVLMGGYPMAEVMGILVGHVYYYLEDIYPLTGGTRILKTPQFLYNIFPPANTPQFGHAPPDRRNQPQQPQQPQRGGYQWGRGNVLGN